jgi:haloalkane dehalogenase
MAEPQIISADFPYKSNYVEVHGSKMHYIDEGSGDPVLFLHGNPTSSYLWRNIIPHLSQKPLCIPPNLITFGKSDKPDLEYRIVDHIKYVEGFIEKLELKNLTLVIHDWGSALGFHYAVRHEANVKGIAFMEAILQPVRWSDFPKDFKMGFKLFRTPGIGWLMIAVMNVFIEKLLPQAIVRQLSKEEMDNYRQPFPTVKSRKPLWRMPNEIPIEGNPADVEEIVRNYNRKLQESELPKLLFYAHPGGLIRKAGVEWCRKNLKNLKTVDIGKGIHYLQEDNPHLIGAELAKWYDSLISKEESENR